jgi:8-oxo-dGTP diphosphatase
MSVPRHRVAVVVLVLNEAGEILLVNDARRGWELPGGLVEEGESVEIAAFREVDEETGIAVELTGFRFVGHDMSNRTFMFLFLGKPVEGELCCGDETLEVRYFPVDEALQHMAPKNYHAEILRCLDSNEAPFFLEYR